MSTAAVMENELEVVSEKVRMAVSRLEQSVPANRRSEFDSERQGVIAALEQSKKLIEAVKTEKTPLAQLVESPSLFDRVNKLGSASYTTLSDADKKLLLATRNESERFDRTKQLIRATSEDEFLKALWWLSQRGRSQDLDLLELLRVSHRTTGLILSTLIWVEQEILAREERELLDFFMIDPKQLLESINAAIQASAGNQYHNQTKFKSTVHASTAIRKLRETQQLLGRSMRVNETEKWLATPQVRIGRKTPRDLLLSGEVQRVLELLKESSVEVARTRLSKRIAASVLVVTSLFVVVGLVPLAGTVLGFGMAFGGALLAYESLLLLRALKGPLPQRGR